MNQNRKIVIACIFGMLLIAALIVGGILYTTLSKDTQGAAEDLTVLFSKRYVENYEVVSDTAFRIYVNPEYWEHLDRGQQAEYCTYMTRDITAILWNHKVLRSPSMASVKYYVEGKLVAE